MGLHDRPYWKDGGGDGGGFAGRVTFGMPRPGKAVKWLLIINVGVFVLQQLTSDRLHNPLDEMFAAIPAAKWEIWRYVTFQFLHGGLMHLLFNMLGLYFLGMYLERDWGPKRFLRFYLVCGAAAGLAHVILALIFGQGLETKLIGASGGVYAVVLACAILYPHIRLILFLFPVPIRFAAALFVGISLLNVLGGIGSALSGGQLSYSGISDIAHLGGAAAGVVWVWLMPRLRGGPPRSTAGKINQGAWQRKMKRRADEQAEIDRILQKVHDSGLNSLSRGERKMLQDATQRQQEQERQSYR